MASIDDIMSVQKNGVVAITSYVNSINFHAGKTQSLEISLSTALKSSSGWVANISVVVAGSAVGYIYDTNSSTNLTGNRIYTIPNTVGMFVVNLPTNSGIVVIPGTGQIVALGYS